MIEEAKDEGNSCLTMRVKTIGLPVHGIVKSSGEWGATKTNKNFFTSAPIIFADANYTDCSDV